MHMYDNQEFKKKLFFSTIMDPETRWGEEDAWIFFLVYFPGIVDERLHTPYDLFWSHLKY